MTTTPTRKLFALKIHDGAGSPPGVLVALAESPAQAVEAVKARGLPSRPDSNTPEETWEEFAPLPDNWTVTARADWTGATPEEAVAAAFHSDPHMTTTEGI